MDSDWLTFEQAAQIVDGPEGWKQTEGGRPSALSLLMLARGGNIATNAQVWSVRRRSTYENGDVPSEEPPFEADPESRAAFFQMLFMREKLSSDAFHAEIAPGLMAQYVFSLADDRAGIFEAASVLTLPQSKVSTWHSVVGLRFSREDICRTLSVTLGSPVYTKRRGRPKNRGGYAKQDEHLIQKMAEMIAKNPGMVPYNAAQHFIDQAAGGGGDEAKRRRLADRYSRTRGG